MSNTPRRAAGPRLEALEDRWMPAVMIGGYVHEDCNANGLFESSIVGTAVGGVADEVGMANSLLQLIDSSGQVVSTTASDASGRYVFTRRDNVSTTPVQLSYEADFAQAKTDLDRAAGLRQFDPSFGTLQSIQIIAEASAYTQATLENLEDSAADLEVELHSTFRYDVAGLSPITATIDRMLEANVGAFDGQADMQGSSSKDFGVTELKGAFATTTISDPAAMSAFLGTGDVQVRQSVDVTSCACGTGNLLAMVRSMGAGKVRVVYNYTPSNALTPGQYTIRQLGPIDGYNDGLDTSNNTTAISNSNNTDVISVTVTTPNDTLMNNHFGEMRQAHVLGRVYHDVDVSGGITTADVGLHQVTLQLSGTDAFGASVTRTTTTDSAGFYAFRGLTRGTYTVTEIQPAGFLQGTNTLGTAGGTQSGDSFTLSLTCGQTAENYDFGERTPSTPPPPTTPPSPPLVTPPPQPFTSTPSKFFFIGRSWLDLF